MKPTPRDVQWLVSQLDDQKRRLKNLENRKPGLAYSSIEDGAIREYGKDGTLGSQTGKQSDGTHGNVVLNGPKPPKPTDATVAAIPGMVELRWNGKFAGDIVSPLDLKHVAGYVVPVGEVLDLSKQAGVMTGELGDNLQVQVDPGVYNVYLVSWSKAGRFSDAAGPVPVLVPVAADVDAIQAALDDLDERYDGVITEAGQLGDRLDAAETELVDHETRLVDNDAALDILSGEVLPQLELDLAGARAELALLPGLITANEAKVDSANTRLDTLSNTTLPALESGLADARASLAPLPGLIFDNKVKADAAKVRLDALSNTTLPALEADLVDARAELALLPGLITANTTKVDAAKTRLDNLDSTTLPGLAGEIEQAGDRIADAEATLAPLSGALSDAQAELDAAVTDLRTVDSRIAGSIVPVQQAIAAADVKAQNAIGLATTAVDGSQAAMAAYAAMQEKLDKALAQSDGLYDDPSYELGIRSGTLVPVVDVGSAAHHGTKVAKFDRAAGPGNVIQYWEYVPVVAAHVYRVEMWARANAGASSAAISAFVQFRNAAGAVVQSAYPLNAAPVGADWVRLSAELTAPAGAVNGRFQPMMQSATPAGVVVWVDEFNSFDITAQASLLLQVTEAKAAAETASQQALDALTAANLAQSSADGKTNTSYTASTPSGVGLVIGDTHYQMSSTDNAARILRWWRWSGSAWVEQKIDGSTVANFDAGYITSGFLDVANRIKAGSIFADKLVVGIGSNLIPNDSAETGAVAPHFFPGAGSGTYLVPDAGAHSGGYVFLSNGSGSVGTAWRDVGLIRSGVTTPNGRFGDFVLSEGAEYLFSMWVRKAGTSAVGHQVRLKLSFWTAGGLLTANRFQTGMLTSWGWDRYTVDLTSAVIPVGSVSVTVIVQSNEFVGTFFDDLSLSQKSGGELLVNGSITGEKVNAQSVAAVVGEFVEARVDKLTAGSAAINTAVIQKLAVQIATVIELHADRITAGKLTSGQIDTPNLAAALATILELNADRITAGTVSAARLDVNDLAVKIATVIKLNAGAITSGTIDTNRLNVSTMAAALATILELNADRITAGTISAARLDVNDLAARIATVIKLNAGAITAGTIDTARINVNTLAASLATVLQLNASAITAGTISAARLDVNDLAVRIATVIQLHADRITAGTVNTDRLNTNEIAARVATVIKLNAETIIAGTIATARLDVVDIAAKTAAFQQVDVKNLFATTGTISELVAKKIWADLAIFNKVTTGMLAIGAFDNLVVDPDFTDPVLTAARIAASSGTPTVSASEDGRNMATIQASSASVRFEMFASATTKPSPVVPGAVYRVRYQAKSVGGSASTRPAVTIYRADGTTSYAAVDGGAYATVTSAWAWRDFTWTVPNNATAAYFDIQRQSGGTGALSIKSPAVTRMNGGELVVDGSIKAAHADLGSFAANTGFIADLTARIVKADMFVGKEFHGGIFTGSTFQTSILPNIGLKLDQNGFRAYGPEGGEPVAEIRPDGGTVYSVSDPATGQVLAAMDSTGGIAGQSLGISGDAQFDGVLIAGGEPLTPSHLGTESPGDVGPIFNGRSLLGSTFTNFFEQHPSTADGTSWLTALPQGVISNAWREHVGALTFSGLGGQEHLRILMTSTVQLVTGRAYSITFRTPAFKQIETLNAGTVGYATVRRSDPGGSVTPGGAGGTVAGTLYYYPAGGGAQAISGTTYIRCPEDIPAGKIMFAIQVACYPGLKMESIDSGNSNRWELVVADMGLRTVDNAGRVVNLGKQGAAAAPPAPAPDPDPIRQYTDTISPSWWKAYKGNGDDNTPSFNGKVTQGYSGYAPGNGVMRGMIGFPSQSSRLSGATVKKIEVYVYAEHWHASAGGTLCIGVHTATSQPSTWSSSADDVKRQKMKKPEGRWITLPPSVHNGFKSGSNRGITLLPPGSSTSSEYYGYLVGSKTRLRVTYTK